MYLELNNAAKGLMFIGMTMSLVGMCYLAYVWPELLAVGGTK